MRVRHFGKCEKPIGCSGLSYRAARTLRGGAAASNFRRVFTIDATAANHRVICH